jgi:hypothetical protein
VEATASSVAFSIRNSQYKTAFRKILAMGRTAQKAFAMVVRQQTKREMKAFVKSGSETFPKFTGTKAVEDFSWSALLPKLRESLPIVAAAISGAMPYKSTAVDQPKSRLELQHFSATAYMLTINFIDGNGSWMYISSD